MLRTYHQIRALHAQGHAITLLSMSDRHPAPSEMGEMEQLCERVEVVVVPRAAGMLRMGAMLLSRKPLQVGYYHSAAMRRTLREAIAQVKFDALHATLIRVLPYVWDLPPAAPPVVVDLIDSLALNLDARREAARGALRFAYELEHSRVGRYEREAVRRFEWLAISSPADSEALGSYEKVAVIPNGVDLDSFPFVGLAGRDPEKIVFTGNMGYGPNEEAVLWFLAEVWPLLRLQRPVLRFEVVGTNPSERVRAAARSAGGVEVLGRVPDVAEHLRRATLSVAPMRTGSGIQNKVLEALASGAPVVATSLANRGVGALATRDLLVADEPHDFARCVLRLLDDAHARERMAQAGRAFAEANFRWEEHARRLVTLYETAATTHAARNAAPRRLNVMQMTDVTGRGGAEKALADIALHLDRRRFNVSVCATRSAGNYQPLLDEAEVRTLVQGRTSRWDLAQWARLVRLLRDEKVDVLHTHLFGSNTLGRLLGRAAGVPVVIAHEHWSTITARESRVNRALHRLSDLTFVPSEASKRLVLEARGGSEERLAVLYNGVDTRRFSPPTPQARSQWREEFGFQSDEMVIGFVGRLSPEKGGVDLLIRVAHSLDAGDSRPSSGAATRLLIVGDGPLRGELQSLDRRLSEARGRLSPVVFAGARSDIPRVLGAMDIFVLPSLHEALPIVVLEAMAVGLPVVATQVGGVAEIVQDGATGLLVAPGDEESLRAAITRLADDERLRSRLAQAGLEQVRNAFTIEQMVRQVEEVYERLVYAKRAKQSEPRAAGDDVAPRGDASLLMRNS